MDFLSSISTDDRVTVRRNGTPRADGDCVVYWMQRAQRALDNPALDVAVEAANALRKPVVAFFAPVPFYPHANLRRYPFLNEGIPDIAAVLARKNIGFVLRRFPDHSLLKFCEELNPTLVVSDENPMREPVRWRQKAAKKLKVPLWTVDADVIVPSKLLKKARYAAHTIRPRLTAMLKQWLVESRNLDANISWKMPGSRKCLDPTVVSRRVGASIALSARFRT